MAKDPYTVLGVDRNASQEEIQKVFRKQAKVNHPDLNPGNKQAEQRFKDLSAAYEVLGDKEKRGRFDRGEIDADGNERAQQRSREYAGAGGNPFGGAGRSGFSDFGDAEDIFSQFFSKRGGAGGRSRARVRGQDANYSMNVAFLDAINGTTTQIRLPHGSPLDVKIPPGTKDGQTLRLKGKGEVGIGGGEPGDALIEVHVEAHPFFTREGDDIRIELPITLSEAVLGAKVAVPTPGGAVTVSVPANASSGKVLRLKGRGAAKRGGAKGNLYATLRIVLPDEADGELRAFVERWNPQQSNPRSRMGV
ncbi:DnaJ C-terminal domain-containing protein [Pararhizobium mangrovi]|uniref:J domain-containing protein n=1 Tax=Pararhizobium mangrovi TaxID=2590452 RepID=A0A506UBD5_9HYPH|nr:J domain-containing protein [Pararhizobium mangrovi]TPW31250.1 J domain-containing protein [Pararhizobium mangrovi]